MISEFIKTSHLTVSSNNFNINIRAFKVDQLLKYETMLRVKFAFNILTKNI